MLLQLTVSHSYPAAVTCPFGETEPSTLLAGDKVILMVSVAVTPDDKVTSRILVHVPLAPTTEPETTYGCEVEVADEAIAGAGVRNKSRVVMSPNDRTFRFFFIIKQFVVPVSLKFYANT